MQRRSFLGSLCAVVGGLFAGKPAVAEPERVRIKGKATLLYGQYRLEPVAGDWDGTIKPIENADRKPVEQKPRLLTGSFNVPDGKGGVLPWTKKDVATLACMCLIATGKINHTVILPAIYPHVEWDQTDPEIALVSLLAKVHDFEASRERK